MLNPEFVDWSDKVIGIVKIGFTDEEGDEVLVVTLKRDDASRLAKMLEERVK